MKLVKEDVLLGKTYKLVTEKYIPTPLNVRALIELFKTEGEERGFVVNSFAEQNGNSVIGMYKEVDSALPYVYISAGIHGNEPAPPIALLKLLKNDFFTDDYNWVLCPVMNPYGLSKATRRNKEGFDLNRQYKDTTVPEIDSHIKWLEQFTKFNLTISCHEDHEANGFYLYERHNRDLTPEAQVIIKEVSSVIPIEKDTEVDGEHAVNGVIHSEKFKEKKNHWPELIFLNKHYDQCLHYTFETPSKFPLEQRIKAQVKAIMTAVKSL